MTWSKVEAVLKRPFDDHEINWKLKTVTNNGKALLLAYMDARGVRDRLDEAFGPHWKTSYSAGPSGGVMCTLSVKWQDEWISRCGIAENTNIEAVKGGASDALKRAATAFGVGRHLYDLGSTFATIQDKADYSVPDGRRVYCKGKGYAIAPSIRDQQPHLFGDKPAPKKKRTVKKPKPAPEPMKEPGVAEYLNGIRAIMKSRKLSKNDADGFVNLCTVKTGVDGSIEHEGYYLSNIRTAPPEVLERALTFGTALNDTETTEESFLEVIRTHVAKMNPVD